MEEKIKKTCKKCKKHLSCNLQSHMIDYTLKEGKLTFGTTNWEELYKVIGEACPEWKKK